MLQAYLRGHKKTVTFSTERLEHYLTMRIILREDCSGWF